MKYSLQKILEETEAVAGRYTWLFPIGLRPLLQLTQPRCVSVSLRDCVRRCDNGMQPIAV